MASYPVTHAEFENDAAVAQMNAIIELIRAVRGIRTEVNAPLSKPLDIQIKLQDAALAPVFQDNFAFIDYFIHSKAFEVGVDLEAPALSASAVINGATIYVPLAELIDLDDEIAKLQKESKRLAGDITKFEKSWAMLGSSPKPLPMWSRPSNKSWPMLSQTGGDAGANCRVTSGQIISDTRLTGFTVRRFFCCRKWGVTKHYCGERRILKERFFLVNTAGAPRQRDSRVV